MHPNNCDIIGQFQWGSVSTNVSWRISINVKYSSSSFNLIGVMGVAGVLVYEILFHVPEKNIPEKNTLILSDKRKTINFFFLEVECEHRHVKLYINEFFVLILKIEHATYLSLFSTVFFFCPIKNKKYSFANQKKTCQKMKIKKPQNCICLCGF
jgi:hypothetical protein